MVDFEERIHDAAMQGLGLALCDVPMDFEHRGSIPGTAEDVQVYVALTEGGRGAVLHVPSIPLRVVSLAFDDGDGENSRIIAELHDSPSRGLVGNAAGACTRTLADRPVRNGWLRSLMAGLAEAARSRPGRDIEVRAEAGAWIVRTREPAASHAGP